MIDLEIPGRGNYKIKYIVCDVNGTLAMDGDLLPNIAGHLARLSDRVAVYAITANTHGKQLLIDQQLGKSAIIINPGYESEQKRDFVRELGAENVIAIGQGANDSLMLKEAGIGICIVSNEGLAVESLMNADLIMPDIFSALELLENPLRLVATLRK